MGILTSSFHVDFSSKFEKDASFSGCGWPDLIKSKELLQRHQSLLPEGMLTFVVKIELRSTDKTLVLPRSQLSVDMEKMLIEELNTDFTIVTTCDRKKFKVHKNILTARCPIFSVMLQTKMIEQRKNIVYVDDLNNKTMMELLRYIYSERVENLEEVAFDLIYAASKYDLPDLFQMCVGSLAKQISPKSVLRILAIANLHSIQDMKNDCFAYIRWNYEAIRESPHWSQIKNSLLREIMDKVMMLPYDDSDIKLDSDLDKFANVNLARRHPPV
jgi:speckle-type POZ protein